MFNLERRIPAGHLLRRINPVVTRILIELREKLASFYSEIGRPSIDPELMIRILIIGYCYGIRSEGDFEEVGFTLGTDGFIGSISTTRCRSSTFSVDRQAASVTATSCGRCSRL